MTSPSSSTPSALSTGNFPRSIIFQAGQSLKADHSSWTPNYTEEVNSSKPNLIKRFESMTTKSMSDPLWADQIYCFCQSDLTKTVNPECDCLGVFSLWWEWTTISLMYRRNVNHQQGKLPQSGYRLSTSSWWKCSRTAVSQLKNIKLLSTTSSLPKPICTHSQEQNISTPPPKGVLKVRRESFCSFLLPCHVHSKLVHKL